MRVQRLLCVLEMTAELDRSERRRPHAAAPLERFPVGSANEVGTRPKTPLASPPKKEEEEKEEKKHTHTHT